MKKEERILVPWGPLIGKAVYTVLLLGIVQFLFIKGVMAGEISSSHGVDLQVIRAGLHDDYQSIVFQSEDKIAFETPILHGNEAFVRLKNVTTRLAPFRKFKTVDSWVRLEASGRDLNVRVGLPDNFSDLRFFSMTNPDRLVFNLYEKQSPFGSVFETGAPKLHGLEASNNPSELPHATDKAHKEEAIQSQSNGSRPVNTDTKAVKHVSSNNLMTLNFHEVDVREALSAIAMKREINIVAAQDVSGKISVHLYKVDLKQALDAITLAGGVSYHKYDDFYYVYRPNEARRPQAEDIQMRLFRLKFAEIDKVQDILEAIPGMRMIKIHEPTRTVIVEDTPENISKVETIINYWDRMPKQVMIEAKILEISLTADMALGVDWEKVLGDVRIGTGNFSTANLPTSESISPISGTGIFGNVITGAGTRHQFAAALDALQTKTKINTLSAPKILTLNGKAARVQVGGRQGYKVKAVSDGTTVEGIEFIDTGTILKITPYIDDGGNVLLNVLPSINSARIEEEIPVVNSTEVSTWLLAKNGETVFIGGLIQDTHTKTSQMVPCIGSVPGLGVLFGRNTQDSGKSELVVLITPRIYGAEVKQLGQQAIKKTQDMEAEFEKVPGPSHQQLFEIFTHPGEVSVEGP